ncbi:MAG TPA: PaaI family thioesterase [Ktedonobacterales bacterium]|nr:PaaI family thioesterase [Ktedonobacterales bacterium]
MRPDEQGAELTADETASDRLNDRSDYQLCYACGARNTAGLKLSYQREGEALVTTFTPDARYQGFPGYLHGGVLATLLDETLERVSMIAGRWMMTGRLEVRYRRAAAIGQPLVVAGRLVAARGRAVVAEATARAGEAMGPVVAEARATFLPLPAGIAEEVARDYPRFARAFTVDGN